MKIKAISDIYKRAGREQRKLRLTANKLYTALGIDSENYRVINDSHEPILYPKELFDVIDQSYPASWIRTEYDDGEYYIEPSEFSEAGFFEDYFDGDKRAIEIYDAYIKLNGLSV